MKNDRALADLLSELDRELEERARTRDRPGDVPSATDPRTRPLGARFGLGMRGRGGASRQAASLEA